MLLASSLLKEQQKRGRIHVGHDVVPAPHNVVASCPRTRTGSVLSLQTSLLIISSFGKQLEGTGARVKGPSSNIFLHLINNVRVIPV